MIDYNKINLYNEDNRLEAKCAAGGLPESLWETYSAFANTQGGVILLGVSERSDRSLHVSGIRRPYKMMRRFFAWVADSKKVSAKIVTHRNVRIIKTEGKRVIAIEVPRAPKAVRPVYVGGDVYRGTYIRIGEGDYRCTKAEVESMLANK